MVPSETVADSPSWAADSRRLLYQTATGLKLVDVTDNRITDHTDPAGGVVVGVLFFRDRVAIRDERPS